MNKLISSHFARLRKDKLFWLCTTVIFVYAILNMLNGGRQANADMTEYHYTLDIYYFRFTLSIGAFISIFSSMFWGTEYSDGAIRNKIIIGHTRRAIYLSNLLITFLSALWMLLVWMIGSLIGIPFLGTWKMGTGQLFTYLLAAIFMTAAFCAIFTLVNQLSSNKATTAIVSILLFFGLLLLANLIYNRLKEPEMTSGLILTVDGMDWGEPTPNPYYISGTTRNIYEFLADFLPTGQGIKISFLEITRPLRMILSSLFITVSVTLSGLWFFSRKDLK
ncbi:MAG: ABC transporter permease [Blautia sp.]|nr:ABC transporter permease [Lachnoclostridium sp.]MCM1210125.1 ABC transporter permease [Blautia sp.]